MSRSSNSLRTSDVITTPIKLKYTASYDCASLVAYGITVVNGVNGAVTVTGSIPEQTLNYRSLRHLYYSNYLTGSGPITGSSADNFLQSTAAYGTPEADYRYFPTESNSEVRALSIPRNVYGQQLSRKGFYLSSSLYNIQDDGNGNLYDTMNPYYVNFEYYLPEFTDWYVYQNPAHVGNIIYPQGMVIITNPSYSAILPYSPIAYPDTAYFYTSDTPKTVNVVSNDSSGTGTINPASVVLSGGDISSFVNNYDGTVTLVTTTPGIYTTYYTVEADVTGSCSLESNQAAITVYVAPTTTTTTTSTTTTTTTAAPTTTTTTTSTTTTTTTAAATTTTTTSTSTTTTTTPATTTTTSTSTTTTTVPATTTTTTSTTSTTTTVPYNVLLQFYPVNNGGSIDMVGYVAYGTVADNLTFDGTITKYTSNNCSTGGTSGITFSIVFTNGDITGTSRTDAAISSASGILTGKIDSMSIVSPSTTITTNPQDVTIGGTVYRIQGYLACTAI